MSRYIRIYYLVNGCYGFVVHLWAQGVLFLLLIAGSRRSLELLKSIHMRREHMGDAAMLRGSLDFEMKRGNTSGGRGDDASTLLPSLHRNTVLG